MGFEDYVTAEQCKLTEYVISSISICFFSFSRCFFFCSIFAAQLSFLSLPFSFRLSSVDQILTRGLVDSCQNQGNPILSRMVTHVACVRNVTLFP
jgi:hypothetical protein